MKRIHSLVALGLVPLLASVCAPVLTPAHADGEVPKIMLVLDASGSMAEPDPAGGTKMAAAKTALGSALESMPANAEVGLRVYGAGHDGGGGDAACTDSQVAHPLSALDKPGLTSAIEGFQPRGDTPIAYSLSEASKDLGDSGKRHIILVSDGEETCDPDPCATIRQLISGGVDIQIDTVGFGVDDKTRQELQCIAEAGDGSYYDAADAKGLESSLERLSARTGRPYTVSGIPVQGALNATDAPVLTAGQYTDLSEASTSADTRKFYKVKRQWPNSTIRVNMVARLPGMRVIESLEAADWTLQLRTPTGDSCHQQTRLSNDVGNSGTVISETLVSHQLDPKEANPSALEEKCANAEELEFMIGRPAGSGGEQPVEIRVIEEPPTENAADLPPGVTELQRDVSKKLESPASGTPQQVIGGSSFNDATEITPGTFSAEVIPGEKLFFKTRLDYGQSAIFAMDGLDLTEPVIQNASLSTPAKVAADVFAPDFSNVGSESRTYTTFSVSKSQGVRPQEPEINMTPEVRFRNRWDSPEPVGFGHSRGYAMDGYYYYVIGLGSEDFLAGQPANLRFSVAVNGEVAGRPESTVAPEEVKNPGSTDSPAGGSKDQASGDTSQAMPSGDDNKWVLYVAGGSLVVLGGGGAAYALIRCRRI
ncbi:MAG: VWA domain-containing protein [Propionibacteriaceae bacterium]|nr:VWA domain-containing protein [Propionibacteriaceae bacterium]